MLGGVYSYWGLYWVSLSSGGIHYLFCEVWRYLCYSYRVLNIAISIEQSKCLLIQPVIWWVFIRRLGKLEVAEESQWDDERMFQSGEGVSLLNNYRKRVKEVLEVPKVSYFIYVMVILLCIVILVELSIADYIQDNNLLKDIFRYINFILLLFFVIEIILRTFADGIEFLTEPINLFDSCIVFSSFIMNILRIEARIVGILRILRLIKGKPYFLLFNFTLSLNLS
jgi:hypothetical protein